MMARSLKWLLIQLHSGHHVTNNALLWRVCQLSLTTTLVSIYTFVFVYLSISSLSKSQDKSHPVLWLHPKQLSLAPNESQLIDINDFRYTLRPKGDCRWEKDGHEFQRGDGLYFVIYVHSSPHHLEERQSIRSTWGSVRKISGWGVKVIFLLGETSDGLQRELEKESQHHQDMVQGNFVDSYRNLSYKHLMGYKWILTNCPKTKFILKVDDDTFVDVLQLYTLLNEIYRYKTSGVLACSVWPAGSAPQRHPDSKWLVDYNEYPYDTYPAYCGGLAYVVSPDIAKDLLAASQYVPFFWIDDLYVTGLLADKIPHVRHHALNLRTTYDSHALLSWLRETNTRPCPYIFGDVNGSGNRSVTMHKLWKKTQSVWTNLA